MKKILIAIFIVLVVMMFFEKTQAENLSMEALLSKVSVCDRSAVLQQPVIRAGSAIVMDMNTGRVLFEKNADTKTANASTTKIMTGIVAIEHGDLEELVTISAKSASVSGSQMHLKKGQTIKLQELLYGLLMVSGNDAAIAIAEHIGGSVEKFAELMNQKAKELGAVNTHFVSPHGLDMSGHYSTAYDLAIITQYALKNPIFSEIVGTKKMSISIRDLFNTNEMLNLYQGADGVKTGYTGQAGRCLVTSATREGWRIISVVLQCETKTQRTKDSQRILDYAFANYKPVQLMKNGECAIHVEVVKGKETQVGLSAIEDVIVPLRSDEVSRIIKSTEAPKSLQAPVYKDIEYGQIAYLLDGDIIGQVPIKASKSVERKRFFDYFTHVFEGWFGLANRRDLVVS